MTAPSNRIRCRYCAWSTYRFQGKKSGEMALRNHVVYEHETLYLQSQGLSAQTDERPYVLDEAYIGEQAL